MHPSRSLYIVILVNPYKIVGAPLVWNLHTQLTCAGQASVSILDKSLAVVMTILEARARTSRR
jgi:hypothetical protein